MDSFKIAKVFSLERFLLYSIDLPVYKVKLEINDATLLLSRLWRLCGSQSSFTERGGIKNFCTHFTLNCLSDHHPIGNPLLLYVVTVMHTRFYHEFLIIVCR